MLRRVIHCVLIVGLLFTAAQSALAISHDGARNSSKPAQSAPCIESRTDAEFEKSDTPGVITPAVTVPAIERAIEGVSDDDSAWSSLDRERLRTPRAPPAGV